MSWDEATSEIATKLQQLIDAHGSECVAAYFGNPLAFNTLATPGMAGFLGQLHLKR